MAIGRAIITGDTSQARDMLQQADTAPFLLTPQGDPVALASAIIALAEDSERRRSYAESARRFYEKNLSSKTAIEQIVTQFIRVP
jgi:glycosyltransferase involved in cell wall biosynthesis